MDKYNNFQELKSNEIENVDYKTSFGYNLGEGSNTIIISIHSGSIEGGTGEIASQISKDFCNHYDFSGLKSGDDEDHENQILHISSNKYDDPWLEWILEKMNLAVSIHGAKDKEIITYVGGLNHFAIDYIVDSLIAAGFNATSKVPAHLSGKNLSNIINKTPLKAGVQIEVSQGQRNEFFVDWKKRNLRTIKNEDLFFNYCNAIIEGIKKYNKN